MNNQITESLTTLGNPGLLEATEHNVGAQNIAKRILRHSARTGHILLKDMSYWDRQRHRRISRLQSFMLVEEQLGRW